MHQTDEGPYIVSTLLAAAKESWHELPAKVLELFEAGRVEFKAQAMAVTTATGYTLILSPTDVLWFKEGEPYAVVHLH